MKRIALILVILVSAVSCNRNAPEYRPLKGMWQNLDDRTLFYSFEREYLQIKKLDFATVNGIWTYSDGTVDVSIYSTDDIETLSKVMLPGPEVALHIDEVSKHRLVLSCEGKVLKFRKY